jgi:benzodiazapine receptor
MSANSPADKIIYTPPSSSVPLSPKKEGNKSSFWVFFISVIITALVGFSFTKDSLKDGGWYSQLKLPSWIPAKSVFPIVWSILFILMIIGGYWSDYQQVQKGQDTSKSRLFFFMSLVFNAMWSYAFFYNHDISSAVAVNVLLILSIIGYMVYAPIGRYFFIPYLLWSLFALAITINVRMLN